MYQVVKYLVLPIFLNSSISEAYFASCQTSIMELRKQLTAKNRYLFP